MKHNVQFICKKLGGKLPDVATKLDKQAEALGCDDSFNEKILLHGTVNAVLESILHNGMNERFSGGFFGKGTYLAEDPAKIDQYCTADLKKDAGSEDLHLHAMLYDSHKIAHPGKVFYCFACRAALGYSVHTKDGEKSADGSLKLFVSDDKRELSQIPNVSPPISYHSLVAGVGSRSDGYKVARHREFIIFHASQILPTYLIAYERE